MRINKRLNSRIDSQENTQKQIVLEAYFGKQESPSTSLKTKQNYFTNSKRSNCLILPQISQGPQKYNIQMDEKPRSVTFHGYSPRINKQQKRNYNEFQIPGVGKYTINKEILYQKKEQVKPNQLSPKPFREYSYIKTDLQGPSFLEYPKSEEKGLKFNTTERFPYKFDYYNDYYYLFRKKKIISTNTSPAYSIPKASTDILNYSKKKKNQLQSRHPGPGEYFILSKSISTKEIRFSRADRFKQNQQELSPGPGNYTPYKQIDHNISFGKAKRFT